MSNIFKKRGQKIAKTSRRHIEKNLISRFSHVQNIRLLILEWGLLILAITTLAIAQSLWYKKSYSSSFFTSGGTYTEATLGKVNSLNPLLASTNSEKAIAKLLYLGLTAPDYSGHTGNVLAKSISMSQNGKTWTVKLREGLKWSDGEPLTNEDVIYTVNLIKKATVTTSYSANLSGVTLSELKTGELVFNLSAAFVDFDSALNFPILPKHIFEGKENFSDFTFDKTAAYSGPFMFKASQLSDDVSGSIFYLTSNPNYYSKSPLLTNFIVHTFSTTDEIVAALNSGLVTGTAELLPTDSKQITSLNVYEKDTSINSGVYLFLNTTSSIFSNKSLRKALQVGINVDELRSIAGQKTPINFPILPNQFEIKNWPTIPAYDLEKAKSVVASANLDEDVHLDLATISTGYFPTLAEDLAEQLEDLGFKVDVSVYEPSRDFLINVISSRAYDILLYEVSLGAEPDLFAYYHSSQKTSSGLNLSNYSNPIADNAIISARETVDQSARAGKYEAFLKYWVEDVPAIGLYQSDIAYYFNKNSRNFSEDNSLVAPIDRFIDVNDWSVEKTTLNRTP